MKSIQGNLDSPAPETVSKYHQRIRLLRKLRGLHFPSSNTKWKVFIFAKPLLSTSPTSTLAGQSITWLLTSFQSFVTICSSSWGCSTKTLPSVSYSEPNLCVSDWKSIDHVSTFYILGSLRIKIPASISERQDWWKFPQLWKYYARGDHKYDKCQLQ